jgi:hypothetical protein
MSLRLDKNTIQEISAHTQLPVDISSLYLPTPSLPLSLSIHKNTHTQCAQVAWRACSGTLISLSSSRRRSLSERLAFRVTLRGSFGMSASRSCVPLLRRCCFASTGMPARVICCSIRQHTSAYVSIREHTPLLRLHMHAGAHNLLHADPLASAPSVFFNFLRLVARSS